MPPWKALPTIAYWTLPALVGVPIIVRTWFQHPLLRKARSPPPGPPEAWGKGAEATTPDGGMGVEPQKK